jgi:hypothetical protein
MPILSKPKAMPACIEPLAPSPVKQNPILLNFSSSFFYLPFSFFSFCRNNSGSKVHSHIQKVCMGPLLRPSLLFPTNHPNSPNLASRLKNFLNQMGLMVRVPELRELKELALQQFRLRLP